MEAMKAEGQARLEPPRNPGYASMGYCTYANNEGPALASPHACCFVPWLLLCAHRRRPCFLLDAMLLR